MPFKASAPGSLMVLGEYAVLHGKHALVAAINQRITVVISPRSDQQITLTSALGHFATERSQLKIVAPFQFVLAALQQFQPQMKTGCDLTIQSEFSDQMGLGSSSAVTVATLAALSAWLNIAALKDHFFLARTARQIIRTVQGTGSGADAAASVFGGILSYRMQPLHIEKFSTCFPLTVIYSGSKTPTAIAIEKVRNFFTPFPALFKQICQGIEACTLQGIQAVRDSHWQQLGSIMNIQQGIMEALQVNTPALQTIITDLRNKNVWGAKISGSGLGDCVIAIGEPVEKPEGHAIPIHISSQGVSCEKI